MCGLFPKIDDDEIDLKKNNRSVFLVGTSSFRVYMENSRQIQDIHICFIRLNTTLKHQQVNGCGIDSMSQIFVDLGYKVQDGLWFPIKKV